ncbi:MAG: serine/threonine protein kinase [Bradymonadales bacterium]|nr:serine/threonine protein kinase [Bradymonadales bacterium]
MKGDRGICPSCCGIGRIGLPCTQSSCRSQDYAFIPEEFFLRHSQQPEAFRDPLVGRRFEEYLLVEKLGKGAFGRVFLALQLPVMMKAAIKLLLPRPGHSTIQPADAALFEIEATALARLSHPNIVRLLKFGDRHAPPYLAMEYVGQATDLHQELARSASQDEWPGPREAWHILRQVLFALQAAHAREVMHGDINPNNILLQDLPGYPRLVRILDFGLGRLMDERDEEEEEEEPGGFFGTGVYIAPETLRGEPIGPWTDLYAVGVLAFLLLFRDIPFHCSNRDELFALKADGQYDPTTHLAGRRLSVETLDLFRRALAVRPEHRYRQADLMLAELQPIVEKLSTDR